MLTGGGSQASRQAGRHTYWHKHPTPAPTRPWKSLASFSATRLLPVNSVLRGGLRGGAARGGADVPAAQAQGRHARPRCWRLRLPHQLLCSAPPKHRSMSG